MNTAQNAHLCHYAKFDVQEDPLWSKCEGGLSGRSEGPRIRLPRGLPCESSGPSRPAEFLGLQLHVYVELKNAVWYQTAVGYE